MKKDSFDKNTQRILRTCNLDSSFHGKRIFSRFRQIFLVRNYTEQTKIFSMSNQFKQLISYAYVNLKPKCGFKCIFKE